MDQQDHPYNPYLNRVLLNTLGVLFSTCSAVFSMRVLAVLPGRFNGPHTKSIVGVLVLLASSINWLAARRYGTRVTPGTYARLAKILGWSLLTSQLAFFVLAPYLANDLFSLICGVALLVSWLLVLLGVPVGVWAAVRHAEERPLLLRRVLYLILLGFGPVTALLAIATSQK
jgi:hypothetical protein